MCPAPIAQCPTPPADTTPPVRALLPAGGSQLGAGGTCAATHTLPRRSPRLSMQHPCPSSVELLQRCVQRLVSALPILRAIQACPRVPTSIDSQLQTSKRRASTPAVSRRPAAHSAPRRLASLASPPAPRPNSSAAPGPRKCAAAGKPPLLSPACAAGGKPPLLSPECAAAGKPPLLSPPPPHAKAGQALCPWPPLPRPWCMASLTPHAAEHSAHQGRKRAANTIKPDSSARFKCCKASGWQVKADR